MARPIEKINRDSVAHQVFGDLKDRILTGEFTVGQKLPGEHSLSADYGVSRASVRAALQKLGTLGLVESRAGEGTFVREGSFDNLMREVSLLVAQESMTPFVAEFRDVVEKASTALAIERASDSELDRFVELAGELERVAVTGDVEKYLECDYNYHLALCRLSHNPLLELIYGSIRELFRLSIRANLEKTAATHPNALQASARTHLLFSQTVQRRDASGALAIIDSIVNNPDTVDMAATESEG
ncbi:FadR family transcriptional regulator [Pseudonocardia sp. C8]|uniref:FadR/GntR family transcriptional regulator n=1 Tax=Pseudonocardia sp. C8 TaxID=2762759 RepID=UPI001642C2D6|nr:FCD domain-containing protein [Pseudonocardia sp. C8]MBC3194882.1 FadR family transcriptional regulator [Pseudonocardia sp. C8]